MGNLTSCGNQYKHKNPAIDTKQLTYKIDKLFFDLERARFIEIGRQGHLFVTEWALRNTSDNAQKIRLSEKANETYLLYDYDAKKLPLYGAGIGTCEGTNDCLSYINILPQQRLTFVLKTPPVYIPKTEMKRVFHAKLRARFEIKETNSNYYTYPVDVEFNDLFFKPDNNLKIYHENK